MKKNEKMLGYLRGIFWTHTVERDIGISNPSVRVCATLLCFVRTAKYILLALLTQAIMYV